MHAKAPLLLFLTACGTDKGLGPDGIGSVGDDQRPSVEPDDTDGPAPDDPETGVPLDTGMPLDLTRWTSPLLDDGFGTALAIEDEFIWVGAPHGSEGRVYRIDGTTVEQRVSGSGRLGSALALGPEGILIGAPLTDEAAGQVINEDGETLVAGVGGTGLAILGGTTPAVAHGTGWSGLDGTEQTTINRPTSLARNEGAVGVGMARGETCFQVGDKTLARPSPADFAGFSVATGDLDADGSAEWVIGAPGSATVYILDGDTLEVRRTLSVDSTGFGTALATCHLNGDGRVDLVIGAPGGAANRGEVWVATDPLSAPPETAWTGETTGQFLGTSLACRHGTLVMGAPGGGDRAGQVWVAR